MAPDYARARFARYRKGRTGRNLAQYNLGRMYHSGTGVEQNDTQAYWFKRKAALQGHCASEDWHCMYGNGKGCRKNLSPCRALNFKKSALSKRAATRNIRWGYCYYIGKVSKQDYTSRQYTGFEKRQTRGDDDAYNSIGWMYKMRSWRRAGIR